MIARGSNRGEIKNPNMVISNNGKMCIHLLFVCIMILSIKLLIILNKPKKIEPQNKIIQPIYDCKKEAYISKLTPELNYIRSLSCDFNLNLMDKIKWYYSKTEEEPIQKVNEPIIHYNIDKLYIIVLFICVILISIYLLKIIKLSLQYSKIIEERINKLEEDNKELRKIINEFRNPKSSYM
jgi:hypothetical protein